MISSGCHDDYDNAPCIPAFTSTAPTCKKPRKDNLSEALTGAAVTFAKAVSGGTPDKAVAQSMHQESPASTPGADSAIIPGVSPRKAVDLRMKNYEQLRYLQQLHEDGILDQKEFMEKDILTFVKKL